MINFLFLLCVSYAGADNCDYSWFLVDDLDSAGSYDAKTKTVLVGSDRFTEVIVHEIKHIICELEHPDPYHCNLKADLVYTSQPTRQEHTSRNTPPVITGKMMETLGLISSGGTTQQ